MNLPTIRSYSLNGYLGWTTTLSVLTPNYTIFKKNSELSRMGSAKIFLLLDVLPENLCLPGFVVNMPGGADGFYHYPSSLHKRGGVVSFADGHVEAHRWTDARTRPIVPAGGIVAHSNPSANNADLAWLRERATIHN